MCDKYVFGFPFFLLVCVAEKEIKTEKNNAKAILFDILTFSHFNMLYIVWNCLNRIIIIVAVMKR